MTLTAPPPTLSPMTRPEWEVLLCCSRTQLNPHHYHRLHTLLQTDLDWQHLLDLATYHGVLPLLAWHLTQAAAPPVPDSIRQHLQSTLRENLDRNLALTTELLKLTKHFATDAIPLLSFKGPLLAQQVYGHLGLRQFVDLDILVPEAHALTAIERLIQQGYEPQFDFTLAQQKTYVRLRNELTFWHEAKQIAVDLHWELLPKGYSFCPHPELVWQNCQTVEIGGKPASTFSSENLLLFLCVHGAKHDWLRLSWVSDIAELLRSSPTLDWDWIQSQSGKFGTDTMLWLGLALAHDLLDALLPEAILTQLKELVNGHPARSRLRNENSITCNFRRMGILPVRPGETPAPQVIKSTILSIAIQARLPHPNFTQELNPISWQSVYRQTIDSPRDKLWYWLDALITPTPTDWQWITLPQGLFFLYYPLRLLRLIGKYSLGQNLPYIVFLNWFR